MNRLLTFSATYFINTVENKAEFSKDTQTTIIAQNAATIESSGIEAEAKIKYDPIEVYFNYSEQTSESKEDEPGDYERIKETFGFPDKMWTAGATLALPDWHFFANAEARFVGMRVGHYLTRGGANKIDNRYELGDYTLINLTIGTEGLKLFGDYETRMLVSVKNLADEKFEYPGFQPYYRVDLPGQPRTVFFNVVQDM